LHGLLNVNDGQTKLSLTSFPGFSRTRVEIQFTFTLLNSMEADLREISIAITALEGVEVEIELEG
jgi:hypothetical protein